MKMLKKIFDYTIMTSATILSAAVFGVAIFASTVSYASSALEAAKNRQHQVAVSVIRAHGVTNTGAIERNLEFYRDQLSKMEKSMFPHELRDYHNLLRDYAQPLEAIQKTLRDNSDSSSPAHFDRLSNYYLALSSVTFVFGDFYRQLMGS